MTATLNQLIDQVREELLSPRRASTPEAIYPFLFVEEIELEIEITISSTAAGSGKVSIQVVEMGGDIERTNERTHRIKIKMSPLLTKDEVRAKLRQSGWVWERTELVTVKATTKEGGMTGKD